MHIHIIHIRLQRLSSSLSVIPLKRAPPPHIFDVARLVEELFLQLLWLCQQLLDALEARPAVLQLFLGISMWRRTQIGHLAHLVNNCCSLSCLPFREAKGQRALGPFAWHERMWRVGV